MLVFPQLLTGANAQYPLLRETEYRTVVNRLDDGTELKFEDASAQRVRWTLPLASLNDAERQAVEQLYIAAEGQLQTFLLLDPGSNLLAWSEDLTRTVWHKDPQLVSTTGIADPAGGTAATQLTNSGAATQQISQSIGGPGNFLYAFSVFVKGSGNATLSLSSGGANIQRTFNATAQWTRISFAGNPGASAGTSVTAAIIVPAGGSVAVFGPQLDAQPAAGPYRRSQGVSGVFPKVRFDMDPLTIRAVGLDRNTTVLKLVTVG